ncbi:MAG TPA: response regulator transcription factor [Candidatus Merdivicinus excrementipullorum]|uniref:Stage 0 sporulation protein A homolog n=1 Tax=Candidatus Merdivicinus excrementipullorum TaxID=2840867 RepID=A0A9D1JYH2_9FIRM|nr:response regulator transcription factor [Candidatus Merdivicinus excrementipullorum]
MVHILVVDDEEQIRNIIKKYAAFEGYQVSEAVDGMEAVEICRQKKFDLIIMDVMMPELDGFSACREIRKTSDTPVLMLSARGEEYDRIHGFEIGVDDYVVKPFSPRELMMRVQAILKRSRPAAENSREVYQFEGLTVDMTGRIVTIDGQKAELSPKEYDLLFYLVRNRGIALSRETLITNVWGYDFYGDDRTLDTHIKLLRKSLGVYSKFIVTLRGVGYRFEA